MKRYLRYVLPAGGSFIAMAAFGFQCIAGPVQGMIGAEVFTVGYKPADMAAAAHVLSGSLTNAPARHNPAADTAATPPPTWQEHWFEHRQEMRRVFSNASISVYYDKETPETITWPDTLLTKVWNYTTQIYGAFGKDNRLFVLLHTGKYAGGHPSTYFDRSHDYRNVIDVGHAGDWISPTGWNLDAAVHEVGHIVEGASKGVHGSPGFPIWKDSKWMEIYQYDVYRALGWDAEAQRWFNMQMKSADNFPRPGTQWFKNWFYPLYHQYGGAKVLNNFFTLLAANFPRNGNAYTRDMNWGEFIHFWSGAAGVNLKQQATIAFGWPDEWEAQFRQAQKDFPGVKYK